VWFSVIYLSRYNQANVNYVTKNIGYTKHIRELFFR